MSTFERNIQDERGERKKCEVITVDSGNADGVEVSVETSHKLPIVRPQSKDAMYFYLNRIRHRKG